MMGRVSFLNQRKYGARHVACVYLCLAVFCLGDGVAASPGQATIRPSVVKLALGETTRFHVDTAGSRVAGVRWLVNDVEGGTAASGTIDAGGLFRAPATAAAPGEVSIRASIKGSGSTSLWATVLIGPTAARYRLVQRWGERGEGAGRFLGPHGISLDNDGHIIVIDSVSSRVSRYAVDGRFLGEVGSGAGSERGAFKAPRDARVDARGRVFVSDADNHRIQVFSPEGRLLQLFGQKGSGRGELLRAHALDFDQRQRLYVADVDNSRIAVFSHSGKFLFAWGKDGRQPGEFRAPHGIGVDPNGDVIVSNYYGPCQKFTPKGEFLFDFAPAQPPDGYIHFHSMAVDRWGNVYLTARDRLQRGSIVKYNNNGDFITSWRLSAEDLVVESVTIDAQGKVYAAYRGSGRMGVEVYAPG